MLTSRSVALALLGAFALTALTGAMPAAGPSVRTLEQRVLDYATKKKGQIYYAPWQKESPRQPNCAALVWKALVAAGAQGGSDGNWGVEFTNRAEVRPGDVVQFDGVAWQRGIWKGLKTAHHSGIVVSLRGTQLTLLHQNDSTPDRSGKVFLGVKSNTCDLAGATGSIRFFHPRAQ
jgi:hypothetical protein